MKTKLSDKLKNEPFDIYDGQTYYHVTMDEILSLESEINRLKVELYVGLDPKERLDLEQRARDFPNAHLTVHSREILNWITENKRLEAKVKSLELRVANARAMTKLVQDQNAAGILTPYQQEAFNKKYYEADAKNGPRFVDPDGERCDACESVAVFQDGEWWCKNEQCGMRSWIRNDPEDHE